MKQLRPAIAVLLTAVLVISLLPFAVLADECTLGKSVDGVIDFTYSLTYEDGPLMGEESVYYSDSFFSGSAFDYDHALATASIAASMSATSRDDPVGGRTGAVTRFLTNIGCEPELIRLQRFDEVDTTDDICAVAFGVKNLPGTDCYLVPVLVRGILYKGEWMSNARIYDASMPDYASGFYRSAQYAASYLEQYIADLQSGLGIDRSQLKLWICGYSRGAAIANDLARIMTDAGGIAPENIYGYSFATPATVRASAAGDYRNIFSICSEMDLVTRVPPEEWGCTRFGTTLYLPCLSKCGSSYSERLAAMQTEFDAMMARAGCPEVKNAPFDYQEMAVDLALSLLTEPIASPEEYAAEGWQDVFVGIMRDHGHQLREGESLATILLDGFLPGGDLAPAVLDFLKNAGSRSSAENISTLQKLLARIDLRKPMLTSMRDLALVNALYGLFADYLTCLQYEKLTDGHSHSSMYYHVLFAELAALALQGGNCPLLVQHWSESYLAWMKSGTAEELLTDYHHASPDLRTPLSVGDVNADGSVNSADASLLRAYLLAPRLVSIDKTAADIDGSGRIDLKDLTKLDELLAAQRSAKSRTGYLQKLLK